MYYARNASTREVLMEKEYQLKKSFMKFDKFLKDNDVKRDRALTKTREERSARKHKVDEISKLLVEMESLRRHKDKTLQKLERYLKYR